MHLAAALDEFTAYESLASGVANLLEHLPGLLLPHDRDHPHAHVEGGEEFRLARPAFPRDDVELVRARPTAGTHHRIETPADDPVDVPGDSASRDVGERPHATESGGLDVQRLRYPAVILANGLAAFGGGALVMSSAGGFVPGMTEGRGFIALGVVVVARWNPLLALATSALFGLSQALQFIAGQVDLLDGIPHQVWLALPYVATVLAVLLSRGSRYPAAVGIPWRRETAGRA